MKTGGFLNPEDIRNLINANIDSHAPHFTFMTTHGTIFGHDKNQDIKNVRKFGAFAGTTWLRHEKAVAGTGQASIEPDFGLNGKTLKVVIREDGKGLQSMVVKVGGMVSAVCYVKERTLLAAHMEKEKFVGETDEIAAMFLGDNDGESASERAGDRLVDGDVTSNHSEDSEHSDGSVTEDGRGKEPASSSIASSTTSSDSKLSKIRILEIRAETMAKAFAEEICGPEFRMPPDFK